MWRRERRLAEVLRVGRHAVERWSNVDGSLSLIASQSPPRTATPQIPTLASAMGALYTTPVPALVTVVVESAWLPVMCLDIGPTLLRAAQIEVLARHRFGMYELDHLDSAAQWELRIEHRPGTRNALAYGLSPMLKQTISSTAQRLGLELAALTPAFAWGRDRFRVDKARSRFLGWWLWPEQDRTLMARMASNDVLCLNAGAEKAANDSEVLRLVEAERARWGIEATREPTAAATWEIAPPSRPLGGGPVEWISLRGRSVSPPGAVLASDSAA